MNWADVLSCFDLDEVVQNFTQKLNFIYDQHAPWIVYQKRKNYAPWMTKDLKYLISERNRWKQIVSTLNLSHNSILTDDKQHAITMFKYYRNKVNNKKKYDELQYKK